jgi:hypothetical protein
MVSGSICQTLARLTQDGHKVHVRDVQRRCLVAAFGGLGAFVNVVGMGREFWVMRGVVVLEDTIPLGVQTDVGVIVLSGFCCGVQPGVDDRTRAASEDQRGVQGSRVLYLVFGEETVVGMGRVEKINDFGQAVQASQ